MIPSTILSNSKADDEAEYSCDGCALCKLTYSQQGSRDNRKGLVINGGFSIVHKVATEYRCFLSSTTGTSSAIFIV